MNEDKKLDITPFEYFEGVKDKINEIDLGYLNNLYDNCTVLLKKYQITGQVKAAKKLQFHLESLIKEIDIIQLGINKFVYRDDIEEFIDHVSDKPVKIIELENYDREIPDDIVDLIEKVKDKFDRMYVVFTDYTGETTKRVEKERREKDPILFGTLQSKETNTVIDRFYYVGDWIDEYCDLTLDKMVYQMKNKKQIDIARELKIPETLDELREQLTKLDFTKNNQIRLSDAKKVKLLDKVKSWMRK